MTVVHQVGYARADPLEQAYRTIDRLSDTLHRAWQAVHANHIGPPSACTETICVEIRKVADVR